MDYALHVIQNEPMDLDNVIDSSDSLEQEKQSLSKNETSDLVWLSKRKSRDWVQMNLQGEE